MNLNELHTLLTNRLNILINQKQVAVSQGDLDLLVSIESEINETQLTVDKLAKLL